jgi:hypothetical protein
MKKPKIFFNPISGSSILSITWFPGPLGDAVEAKNGIGIGFFAHNGDLLSVQFDDVNEKHDHQVLEFDRYRVEVEVNKGKISYALSTLDSQKKAKRFPKKRDEDAA